MSPPRSRHRCWCHGGAIWSGSQCWTKCERASSRRRELSRGRDPELAGQLLDEGLLVDEDFLKRRVDIEIGDAIDLRKALPLAGPRGPFRLEVIAAALGEVEVGGERKRMHHLAALLLHRGEWKEFTLGRQVRFFSEFAAGAGKQVA